jgi:glucosamine--fructose-6-phosphate aminotransferase (isomerizing)
MCGIFGIIRNYLDANFNPTNNANLQNLIITALNLLKNRGYDSCGIYLSNELDFSNEFIEKFGIDGEIIKERKNQSQSQTPYSGDIFDLMEEKINRIPKSIYYTKGMGHTRWATHGGKTDLNSHPHMSNDKKIVLVHNGIISNYDELKKKYLIDYEFKSSTDTEVISNMIQYLKNINASEPKSMEQILGQLTELMEGTWACIISDSDYPNKLFFMKNESPLLIGTSESKTNPLIMFTSEPSGFMNLVSKYILLREKTYGYISASGEIKINGEFKELDLIKSSDNDIKLSPSYSHWMIKEIYDQSKLNILIDPITLKPRYSESDIILPNLDFIRKCKYLYIIACGSSYYAGLLASNYFRFTKAFEFVNVFDGGEFTRAHLEAIEDPETNLLVVLISQSGETRDLNIAATICREFSSNRKKKLEQNNLLHKNDSTNNFINYEEKNISDISNRNGEIKIIGIINVIGSLISRRTIENIYTNCGRENAVASTKSCTSQILACLLLAIYKSELNLKLNLELKNKFLSDLNKLETDIIQTLNLEEKIKSISKNILKKNKSSIFLLGKDELCGAALEGALKIKEIAYLHAEGYNISALKHGPYAMIETNTPIILLYKNRDHFVKSIVEEIKTRGAYVIEISYDCVGSNSDSIQIPINKTFTGLLCVIVLQLLSYHLSIAQGINPDLPRNLAKVVTVD